MNQPQLGSFDSIPLSALRLSPTNPRKNFNPIAMAELTRSVQEMGVTQPILARPIDKLVMRARGTFVRYVVREREGLTQIGDAHWKQLIASERVMTFDQGTEEENVKAAQEYILANDANDAADYEIVSGARRYLASKAAELDAIPGIIREMSDDEALDIQMIENLQRQDLHPVEEAEGFRHLLASGHSVEDIAKKAGKTVAHVQRMVKLLSLEVDAKRLFAEGHIALDHALLLARLTPKDQERAVLYLLGIRDWELGKDTPSEAIAAKVKEHDEAFQPEEEDEETSDWRRSQNARIRAKRLVEPTSAQLKVWIETSVLLQLATAPWHLADAQLLPIAGACTDCPKRSGANAALFADITEKDDVCMDPACFGEKQKAQQRRQMEAAKTSGKTLLKISAAASNARLDVKPVQMVKGTTQIVTKAKVKQGQWLPSNEGACKGTVEALVVDGPEKGSVRFVCADQDCKVHKHTVYETPAPRSSSPSETPEQKAAREEEQRLYRERKQAIISTVFKALVNGHGIDGCALLRELLDVERENIYGEFPWKMICDWFDVTATEERGSAEMELRDFCENKHTDQDDLLALLLIFRNEWMVRVPSKGEENRHMDGMMKLAKANGLPKVQSIITAAEKAWDKAHAPAKPAAPAKAAEKKAPAKKAAPAAELVGA